MVIFFLSILSQKLVLKKIIFEVDSAASCQALRKPTYLIYFYWPPLDAVLWIPAFHFLFKSGRNLLLNIHTLLVIRWSLNELTKHQGLVGKIFNVC